MKSSVSFGDRALDRAFVVCGVLALASIWAFHYPAGVDLPQHGNILRILADYGDARTGYAAFYERQLLTPYIITYLLALPFAKLFGALAAVKVILSIAAIATPRTMIRWLQGQGAEAWWGLFGFPLTFGFAYLWGLFSFVFALPFLFSYLMAYRRLTDRPDRRALIVATAWALALCFCHGVTFVVGVLVTGVEAALDLLSQRRLRAFLVRLIPPVVGGVALLAWQLKPHVPGVNQITEWPPEIDRFVSMLSGEFSSWAGYFPGLAGAVIVVVMLFVSRPALASSGRRLVPLGVSLGLFLLLPEMIGGTWLLGMRMVMFVHAFGAAAFNPGVKGRTLTAMRWVSAALVVVCLLGQGVRLFFFNREMRGVTVLSEAIPPYVDVRTLVPDTRADSEAFGKGGVGQAAAWVTAANGGFLSNDSAGYFQLPVRRPTDRPWISEYRWFVARGPVGTEARVHAMVGPVAVVKRADDWWLLESTRPPRATGGLEVVRYFQSWEKLMVGKSIDGGPLRVAERNYADGLGTHALSKVQVHTVIPGRHLRGKVAVDDSAHGPTEVEFTIEGTDGKLLFQSGPVVNRQWPIPFDVPLDGRTDLILSVGLGPHARGNNNAHADWLDLRVGD